MSTENERAGAPDESPTGAPEAGGRAAPAPQPSVPQGPAPQSPPPPPPPAAPPTPHTTMAPAMPPTAEHTFAGPAPAPAPLASEPPGGPVSGPWAAFPPPPPPKKRRTGLLAAIVAATLIAGGVGGGIGYLVADDDGTSASLSADRGSDTVARPPDSVAGIAEAALPSVVTIEAGNGAEGSTGTGFVYDEEGHIMTNNHVVASAANGGTLSVTFSDGENYDAEVVGRAEGYDVAVIRITNLQGRDLAPLPLGDSDQVAVGDATIAIGAPFGLSGTVTTGIISAEDRPVASSDGQGGSASYMNALQTDASINPGNSGGPLLNADGEVIGVNSAIQSTPSVGGEAGSIGLGFAIPINQAERVAQDLIDGGEPIYPIIGASVESGGAVTDGAQIVESTNDGSDPVVAGGPADEAGLQAGDVITRFGDRIIDSGPTLISQIWTYQPGDSVDITYQRDGQERTTTLVLGERVGDQ
ncbi:S1C family serine protease [Streptomyces millisiae]|uniref:Trypsin-like peptidase domain-containing protein n=1 Tax=Streptomyces millisiae TaxID=3075542 RepID=A0ABU2LKI3_9ACTN|nr:trypsin-like peptidase domain-containing protein [Streptomyces sp. DSM 44918]MDT0318096.1 trypsin-like peptidase domain-containing protein [Streptomyces sp. DSM 44918]